MTPEMKARPGPHPVIWGLIVGYNGADETYTIRHPFVPDTFTIRYDAFGHTKASDWFNVRVFDGQSAEDERETHLIALRNGAAYAHGTRYDNDERRAKKRGRPQGFSAYDVWRDAFESEDVPLRAAEHHALTIKGRRPVAAAYVRELAEIFPDAAKSLEAAAVHYDREQAPLEALYDLLHTAQHRKSITPNERAKAQELITKALEAERQAITQIEAALEVLGVSTDELKGGSTMGGTKDAGRGASRILDILPTRNNSTVVGTLHTLARAVGGPEWSEAKLQGVLGNAFSFEMKEGAGEVWQEATLDYHGRFFEMVPRRGYRFQRFEAKQKNAEGDFATLKSDAWDAVRASIDRGYPAIAWQPDVTRAESSRVESGRLGSAGGLRRDRRNVYGSSSVSQEGSRGLHRAL